MHVHACSLCGATLSQGFRSEEILIHSFAANHVVLFGYCCGGLAICKSSGPLAHHTAPPSLLRRIVHRVMGAAMPGQAVSRTQPRKCGGRAGWWRAVRWP